MSLIFALIILLLGVPVGLLIAWMARDELVSGRYWFRILFILAIISEISFFIVGLINESLTSLFIAILALISYVKSNDEKWTKQK